MVCSFSFTAGPRLLTNLKTKHSLDMYENKRPSKIVYQSPASQDEKPVEVKQ